MKKEILTLRSQKIEVRTATDTEPAKICGYAIVYNQESEGLDGFVELVMPNAISNDLATDDIMCLWCHKENQPLGRTKNNTLTLKNDDIGLYFECIIPETSWGNDALFSISRGDVDGVSFGFCVNKDSWYVKDNTKYRNLLDITIFEVSPTTFPAYATTNVNVRSSAEILADFSIPDLNLVSTPEITTGVDDIALKRKKLQLSEVL